MKKRLLSIALIFAIVLSFSPVFNFNTYADSSNTIRVRIEGKDGKLFDNQIEVTNEETGLDLLKTALGEENIEGKDGQWGFLVEGILGEKGEPGEGYSTSWGLYADKNGKLESASVGISSLQLEGIDELLLHIKATDASWSDLTYIPKLEVVQEGNNAKLTAKKIVTSYDENWKSVESEEPASGSVVEIEGIEYTTDKNGEIKVVLSPGNYDVKVSKEGSNYPELVRRTFNITVEENKFNEDDSNYTLWSKENTNVNTDKVWKIKFNKDILESSLGNNILVVDSNKNIIPVEVKLNSENNKIVHVNYPGNGYDFGEYTLYIKNAIKSSDEKELKTALRMPFTVK